MLNTNHHLDSTISWTSHRVSFLRVFPLVGQDVFTHLPYPGRPVIRGRPSQQLAWQTAQIILLCGDELWSVYTSPCSFSGWGLGARGPLSYGGPACQRATKYTELSTAVRHELRLDISIPSPHEKPRDSAWDGETQTTPSQTIGHWCWSFSSRPCHGHQLFLWGTNCQSGGHGGLEGNVLYLERFLFRTHCPGWQYLTSYSPDICVMGPEPTPQSDAPWWRLEYGSDMWWSICRR